MSFIGKEYTLDRSENFDTFLKTVGVSDEHIKLTEGFKSSQTLIKDGDTYTYKVKNVEGPKEIVFKSGVEFEDVIGASKTPIKTTIVVDGNTVTQTINAEKGGAVFKKEYNGDDLLVTITSSIWDGVAKRYYKAN